MSLSPSLPLFFWFLHGFRLLFTFLPLYLFIFKGLDLLKEAGTLWDEAKKLEMEAQCLEADGLEKMEPVVAGSEAEGFYGLLRGAVLHSSVSPAQPPHKNVSHPFYHHLPSASLRSPQDLMFLNLQIRC